MTISKYLAEFIQLYETIKIDTNHLEPGSNKYGVFRSPQRNITRNIDGSATITESYSFYAFQRSLSEAERKTDDEWLEDFCYWVDDYPQQYEYPDIDGDRRIIDIQATGSPYAYTDDPNGTTYQITISITYEREA